MSEQDLTVYLSWRFSIRPIASASSILLPMREVSQEVDLIAPQEESHPTSTIELPPPPLTNSTTERMLEAIETTIGTQEQPMSGPSIAIGEDVEEYLADMVT